MRFLAYQALKLVALWTHLWHTLPNALKSVRKQPTSQTANPTTVDQDLVKTQNTGPPLRGLLGGNLLASSWVRIFKKIPGTESSSGCAIGCGSNSSGSGSAKHNYNSLKCLRPIWGARPLARTCRGHQLCGYQNSTKACLTMAFTIVMPPHSFIIGCKTNLISANLRC